jgi:peptidoglycan/xylan/chitin deacetylase (PgdA/CDA1 family)
VFQRRVPVFCFHEIGTTGTGDGYLRISEVRFKEILSLLRDNHYKMVLPGEPLGFFEKAAVLTFDDGSEDHLNLVAPILKEKDLRGIFFLIAKELVSPKYPRELQSYGQTVGSHALINFPVTMERLGKQSLVESSVCDSKMILEPLTSGSINSFAFPLGEYDSTSLYFARKCYSWLFSVELDYLYPRQRDRLHGRFMLFENSTDEEILQYLRDSRPWESSWFFIATLVFIFLQILLYHQIRTLLK